MLGRFDWVREQRVNMRQDTLAERLDREKSLAPLGRRDAHLRSVVIATGGTPNPLKVPGGELPGIHQLHSFQDAEALRVAAQGQRLVDGGGAAEVSVVGRDAEVLSRAVTPRVGRALSSLHENRGVEFHLNAEVVRPEGREWVEAVILNSGEWLDADLVLLGIGIQPNSALLADLSDKHSAVPVDDKLHAAPDVYALGDIALARSVSGKLRVEHWWVALQHGMAAAQDMLGSPETEPVRARAPFSERSSMAGACGPSATPIHWRRSTCGVSRSSSVFWDLLSRTVRLSPSAGWSAMQVWRSLRHSPDRDVRWVKRRCGAAPSICWQR